jgi:2-iminobutanoate/2-iminopropanoate deaminase
MSKQVIHTDKVSPARVPLSQAIKVGEWLFVSGQLGIDPMTRKLASGGTGAETRQVCENMKTILEAAGSSLDKVVRVVIYMVDLGELMEMNAVFGAYFPEAPPARTTVQVAGLVGGARVEIDATATT